MIRISENTNTQVFNLSLVNENRRQKISKASYFRWAKINNNHEIPFYFFALASLYLLPRKISNVLWFYAALVQSWERLSPKYSVFCEGLQLIRAMLTINNDYSKYRNRNMKVYRYCNNNDVLK